MFVWTMFGQCGWLRPLGLGARIGAVLFLAACGLLETTGSESQVVQQRLDAEMRVCTCSPADGKQVCKSSLIDTRYAGLELLAGDWREIAHVDQEAFERAFGFENISCSAKALWDPPVLVNPAGPYDASPVSSFHWRQSVSDLPACSSIASSKNTRLNKMCAESSKLTSTDRSSAWYGMSTSQRGSFENKLQAGLIRNQVWPVIYACQCHLTKCGLSKLTEGDSMFMDTYGAYYFENATWGFCKVYR